MAVPWARGCVDHGQTHTVAAHAERSVGQGGLRQHAPHLELAAGRQQHLVASEAKDDRPRNRSRSRSMDLLMDLDLDPWVYMPTVFTGIRPPLCP